jgi:hypothetical protein
MKIDKTLTLSILCSLIAISTGYEMYARADIFFILTETEGPVGTEIILTGTGFAPGPYEAVLGSVKIIDGIVREGLVMDSFNVPNVDPGSYKITVVDSEGNEASINFEVTPSFVVPEYPLGTISAIITFSVAILLVYCRHR